MLNIQYTTPIQMLTDRLTAIDHEISLQEERIERAHLTIESAGTALSTLEEMRRQITDAIEKLENDE